MLTVRVTLCVPLEQILSVKLGQALNVKVPRVEGEIEYSSVFVGLVV